MDAYGVYRSGNAGRIPADGCLWLGSSSIDDDMVVASVASASCLAAEHSCHSTNVLSLRLL